MMRRSALWGAALALITLAGGLRADETLALEAGFDQPPQSAKLRAFWWWLNGNVTEASITRDLEEMKAKGFGGALLVDADGSGSFGNAEVPHGATFLTPQWIKLYQHALKEAARLGLEMTLSPQSGYKLGGPSVKPEDALKQLVFTETGVPGGEKVVVKLPEPEHKEPYYQDVFVVAYRINEEAAPALRLENFEEKTMSEIFKVSAPDLSAPLLDDVPAREGEEDTLAKDAVDITAMMDQDGTLRWEAPPGIWRVLRFGATMADRCKVSIPSQGWEGYGLDVLDEGALRRYWAAVIDPLLQAAGPQLGTTLTTLFTDSWEMDNINWTPSLREEFKKRRGYDMLPYLFTMTGRIVNSRAESNRFLADYRKTLGDLAVDHFYRPYRELTHKAGLITQTESGGPHPVPVDAQRCLGMEDIPMGEFWARSWTGRFQERDRYFVKQPASAAHTHDRPLVAAESFTTMGPHWQETLRENLKSAFDRASCEGLNRIVWHAWVCSPKSEGVPGQQYFAGTHCNPLVTWWKDSVPFFAYLNRVQYMLQQGQPVADVCYYYGDNVPNFTQLRAADPAKVGAGYDYDVVDESTVVDRLQSKNGQLAVHEGIAYQILVLPNRPEISLPVLRKVRDLVAHGVWVVGPRPVRATGLQGYPESDAEVNRIAEELWSKQQPKVVANRTARDVLLARGIKPDFEPTGPATPIDYIHRHTKDAEIYFVSNRSEGKVKLAGTFRVSGKAPELWDAVTGERRFADAYTEREGRITVPIELEPHGSIFVIFREPVAQHPATAQSNYPATRLLTTLEGTWDVAFDPVWGGPKKAAFPTLASWTTRPEDGIKYYSGEAVYTKTFDLPPQAGGRLWLDLGTVKEVADVTLNGQHLGVTWATPNRVEITKALKETGNVLEVRVINFWPNRIIGDQFLPPEKRFTKTNIRVFTKDSALMESGLLGPVTVVAEAAKR